MARQNTELLLLAPFKQLADKLNIRYVSGQDKTNRLPICRNVYFQFGDLRVEQPNCTVVIEVESAGGITNLAKYWEAVESGRLNKPLKMLHVFLQKSQNDYEAHLVVWRFLSEKMRKALGTQVDLHYSIARGTSTEDLAEAVRVFRGWITGNAAEHNNEKAHA